MSEARHLMVEFTQLAQALDAAPDEDTRVQIAVSSAVSLMRGCEHAGFTVNEEGGLFTKVSSDDRVRRANDLQGELSEGPCLDVMRDQDVLVSNDLTQEHRWPRWASRVHTELGVGSMMSLLVYTGTRSYGALSLYADQRHRFDEDDVAVGQALAAHLAMILAAGREIDQLGVAMHNRTIIGQAQGLLMGRLDLNADQAFDYLRRVSSESSRKLSVVAMEITRTRQLPSHPPNGDPVVIQPDVTRNSPSQTPSVTLPGVDEVVPITTLGPDGTGGQHGTGAAHHPVPRPTLPERPRPRDPGREAATATSP